ncbi:cyanophycin synthetase [Massilia sp. Leaf139]|uniref:cyanophycin synthetase n=1 Tax=Massilia sp. Leaf139 TaxID=1736272 RepID=UPI0006F8077D|nr:cyanophycin synthetase [Massilia sp. Leaf139]KQQ97509.1 cyanophycin synthetase [Massilia sp. Leaf139]
MYILEQRFLRGPNVHADTPCLLSVLDLEDLYGVSSKDIPGFNDAMLEALPKLHGQLLPTGQPGGFAQRLRAGTYLARVVEHVTLTLQSMAGPTVGYGRTRPAAGRPGQYRVVVQYAIEKLAEPSFQLAVDLVTALAKGEAFDLEPRLKELRSLASRYSIGTSTAAVLAAAHERGIPYSRITDEANLFQLGWGSKQKRLQATTTGDTSYVAVKIASDKDLTKALLKEAGVPVPEGGTVTTVEDAQRIARRLRAPVTLKPLDGNQGKGVTTRCETPEEVEKAFAFAREYGRRIIVERFVEGRDYRVLVAGGRIAAASFRRPAHVEGDGVSTITELVEIENQNPARGSGHSNVLTRLSLDAHAEDMLRRQGYTPDSVPGAGVCVELRSNANLSTGGTAEDCTDLLPESTRALCVRAAAKIGLDVAGIDIVCRDITVPLDEQGGAVIEVNAAPGIRMHQHPSRGEPRDAGEAIVDGLMGRSNGRIPVIAVTGTNGKTTTTLMIAHAARVAGLGTGVTTTEGVFVNGKRLVKGDCTGYWSARTVLSAPDVDFAVLETARGGILKRGLAFDQCDVGVVLNVAADHLGLDGVDTIEDLAQVKAVVASSASKAVVLNAEDAFCVSMVRRAKPGAEIIFFSMDAENPILLKHLEDGGRGAYLQDNAIVVADGNLHQELMRVEAMPASFGGRARYNIANALAAAAALMASGFSNLQIADGLSTFVSDSKTNPLRTNVFDVRGVTVIVDYAHNPAAYVALAEMARALLPGQLVGIVTAPGDRRDSDLVQIGEVCGERFDELVVYESQSRGRPVGGAVDLIIEGIEKVIGPSDTTHREIEVDKAIRLGLSLCRAGDVLVFACGSSLKTFIDALRVDDPESADRIEAQAA